MCNVRRQCRAAEARHRPLRAPSRDGELCGDRCTPSPVAHPPVSLTPRTPSLAAIALVALPLLAQGQAPRATTSPIAARSAVPDAPLPFDSAGRRGVLPNGIHFLVRRNTKPENRAELR